MTRTSILVMAVLAATAAGAATPAEWPQWRGPFNTGMAAGDAPLHWDDTLSRHQ